MGRDYTWTDDADQRRRSTEIIDAADVTDEILIIATSMEDEWFSHDVRIDWRAFFADLNGSMIPSSGRELDLGNDSGSPARNRIQRHIQKRRMAGIARWRLAATRSLERYEL